MERDGAVRAVRGSAGRSLRTSGWPSTGRTCGSTIARMRSRGSRWSRRTRSGLRGRGGPSGARMRSVRRSTWRLRVGTARRSWRTRAWCWTRSRGSTRRSRGVTWRGSWTGTRRMPSSSRRCWRRWRHRPSWCVSAWTGAGRTGSARARCWEWSSGWSRRRRRCRRTARMGCGRR